MKTLPNLRKFIQRHCFPVENKGQSAVLLIFLTIAFLVIVGISIDTANIFLKKSRLGRALDASVIAAMTSYSSGVNDEAALEGAARMMVAYNLNQMGIPDQDILLNQPSFSVDQSNGTATLSAKADIRVPTLLISLIGLQENIISTTAIARRSPVAISLVLDTSGSMNLGNGNKMTKLKEGATQFVNSFLSGRDSMALIAFSNLARVEVPMAPIDPGLLTNKIQSLKAIGATLISEAVVQGRLELEKMPPDMNRVIVFFTDGSPNRLQAVFKDGINPPLTPNYPPNAPPNFYEYIAYVRLPNTNAFVRDLADVLVESVKTCLSTFAYLDSREREYENGDIDTSDETEQMRKMMMKKTFDLSIIESDYAKTDGITIYVIGLGTEAQTPSGPDAAYQGVWEDSKLRSILLRRIAGDPDSINDPSFPGLELPPSLRTGKYYQTPDPDELATLFHKIASLIKIKLVK